MPSSNQLTPEVITISSGLDYQTPKMATTQGSLSDCLNFEIADRVGMKRIDGTAYFDGSPYDSSLAFTNVVAIRTGANVGSWSFPDLAFVSATSTKHFGIALSFSTGVVNQSVILVAITDPSEYGKLAIGSSLISFGFSTNANLSALQGFDTLENTENRNAADSSLRRAALASAVDNMTNFYVNSTLYGTSGNQVYNPIIGLGFYKDKSYLVQDLTLVPFKQLTIQIFPGDTIKMGSTNYVLRDFQILSGTVAAGTAAGYLLVDAAVIVSAATLTGAPNFDIIRPSGTTATALKYDPAVIAAPSPWMAGLTETPQLYTSIPAHSVASGPQFSSRNIELNWTCKFKNGKLVNGAPPTTIGRTLTPVSTPITVDNGGQYFTLPSTLTLPTGWTATGAPASVSDALKTAADGKYLTCPGFVGLPAPLTISVPNAIALIPADAVLLGFSVSMTSRGVGSAPFYNIEYTLKSGTKTSATRSEIKHAVGGAFAIGTAGGTADTWGTNLTYADLAALSLTIQPVKVPAGGVTSITNIDIDQVLLTIYYQQTGGYYYFSSAASDEIQAVLVSYNITSGAWSTSNAAGEMQFALVAPSTAASATTTSRRSIIAADEMHLGSGQFGVAGTKVADIDSTMYYNGLESLSEITATASQYQMIRADFYGNADWEALYGVSGAGRAFAYDGFYFRRIYTGLPIEKDTPRHISTHQKALVLGYPSGNVTLSTPGDPENFTNTSSAAISNSQVLSNSPTASVGTSTAASIDTSDRVTGLLRMSGTTLGVFGERTIQGLVGTDSSNFSLMVLSPYEGAIEYTVVDMGRPVYCSYKGISVFDQTNAYGDFLGTRLSAPIAPWLLPRLQGTLPPVTFTRTQTWDPGDGAPPTSTDTTITPTFNNGGVLFAMPIRSKNQLLLFFKDGNALVMTLQGGELNPAFTLRSYQLKFITGSTAASFTTLVPGAYCSSVDSRGQERILVTHYNASTGRLLTSFGAFGQQHIFALDRGWCFAGMQSRGIPAYFITNDMWYGTPFDFDTVTKIRIDGLTYGYGPLSVHVAADYANNSTVGLPARMLCKIDLPQTTATQGVSSDYFPASSIVNVRTRGRSINFKFMSNNALVSGDETTAPPCPPFVIQSLMLQHDEGKGDV